MIMNQVGPYQAIGSPVTGAWSRVHRAIRVGVEGEVFLRVFGRLPDAAEARARLERLVSLADENVVRILDVGVWDGQLCVALESWAGDLHLDPQRPRERRIALVRGICSGLSAAHRAGDVHGDLHRGQIRLAHDDRPLLDLSEPVPLAVGGLITRRPYGIAPEMIREEAIDQRSDVFAAAWLCYELLTDRQPFGDDPAPALFLRVLNQDPPALDLPEPLAEWLLRGLAKDPAARFQNGREMSDAFRLASPR